MISIARVSIRSRPEDREKGDDLADSLPIIVSIRSRPEDREKGGSRRDSATRDMFQSAPGPKAGRKTPVLGNVRYAHKVSIRSRPEDREKASRRREPDRRP